MALPGGPRTILQLISTCCCWPAGFQAQTAECLVVGEIAARGMVVALNKVDILPEPVRQKAVKKATKLIRETLAATKFAGAAVIPVSAKPSESAAVCIPGQINW